MVNKKEEGQLIEECRKGTPSAFKAIYELYQGYVYTICIRHGVSAIEVKDYMQTIFMHIFKSIKSFDANKAKFKTWLTRITINQIITLNRKAKLNYTTLEDKKMNLIESNFTIPVESQMDEKIMHELLSKMPAKFISVFNLFIIDGYSHAEIAEKLNITESASRVLLHRGRVWAMRQLKDFFKHSPSTNKGIGNKAKTNL